MGPARKAQKSVRAPVPRNTRNRTRLHKPKLITDPAQSTLQLTNQLRALGLYAAPTLGDGNCLFRALADQLWGSPNGHLTLRAEVCDWMEARKERYEGFVDEDRSFDSHIRSMRVPGTYGGHLELSAFSHLKRRNVKVIQPGLVYIIEWNCGWGVDAPPSVEEEPIDETGMNERDKRRLRRDRKRQEKMNEEQAAETAELGGTVYIAYHDWEHFSSVRNLAGPHTGLPNVVERPERPDRGTRAHDEPVPQASNGKGKGKGKAAVPRGAAKAKTSVVLTPSTPIDTLAPTQIPLPLSRSASPSGESSSLSPPLSQATSSTSASASTSTAPSSLAPLTPPDTSPLAHHGRSPKRTFDEAQMAARAPAAVAVKRRKRRSDAMRMEVDQGVDAGVGVGVGVNVDADVDVDADGDGDGDPDENTPSLSDGSSLSGLTSLASSSSSSPGMSSSLATPPAEPQPEPEPQPELELELELEPLRRPMTRRQRKALGLPHPRTVQMTTAATTATAVAVAAVAAGKPQTRSAGKIVIPGGRRTLRSSTAAAKVVVDHARGVVAAAAGGGEWQTNGTGRLDVRGFRELKI